MTMRRSHAASILKRNERPLSKDKGSFTYSYNDSSSTRRRYFSVVWRDASTRKRKIWKGDGILEVRLPTGEAILRDDSFEYMGSTNVLNIIDDLQADYQMLVQNKDIEILEEFSSEEQVMEMRQCVANNQHLDNEEHLTAQELAEEKKKRKGRFLMPTYIKLKSPKLKKTFQSESGNIKPNKQLSNKHIVKEELFHSQSQFGRTDTPLKFFMQEYVCLIKSSELQQYLLGKIHEFYNAQLSLKFDENSFEEFNMAGVLHMICNHPALVNQQNRNNILINLLSSCLPNSSEMGPFDSGKLEFLQYFLQNSKECNIVMISKCTDTLNMLEGLCDFMNIKCWRLDSSNAKHQQNEICQSYRKVSSATSQQIILMQNSNPLGEMNCLMSTIKSIIVFDNVNEMVDTFSHKYLQQWKQLQHELRIYYLVTAFSIEDYLLFVYLQKGKNNNNDDDDVDELLDINMRDLLTMWSDSKHGAYRVLQTKSRKPLICPFTKWLLYESPFAEQLLDNSALRNCEANIDTILFRQLSC